MSEHSRALLLALTDTAAVSIAGIIVSGVLGPGFAAWWARNRQVREHTNNRRLKELDDLTELLDEAATVLAPGASNLRDAWDADLRGDDQPREIRDWSRQVHSTYERILLRLPESDDVSRSYLQAREELEELGQELPREDEDGKEAVIDRFEIARLRYLAAARARLARERS